MQQPAVEFGDLIAPVTTGEFFSRYYGKEPLYVPGEAGKFDHICGWDEFNRLLGMTTLWTDVTLKMVLDKRTLEASEYCRRESSRDGGGIMQPRQAKVAELMEQGATVVLDLIERLTPGLSAVTTALEMATGARALCNAYCSFAQRQAFDSHFDTMDVFVLHIEGAKGWHIYEGCFDNPIEAPGYNYPSFAQDHHDRTKGGVLLEPELTAGDFLYLPRGQYHDALASSEACLHLSFGTTPPTGLDFMSTLIPSLADVSEFRAALPSFDDEKAHDAHIRMLAECLNEILGDPGVARQMRDDQRRRAFQHLPVIELPAAVPEVRFRVRTGGKGESGLDADNGAIAEWVAARQHFTWNQLAEAFPEAEEDALGDAVARLAEGGWIEPL